MKIETNETNETIIIIEEVFTGEPFDFQWFPNEDEGPLDWTFEEEGTK